MSTTGSWAITQGKQTVSEILCLLHIFVVLCRTSWDIESNPGPYKPKYPCLTCSRACKWGQKAIACDTCEAWYHADCMNMSTSRYEELANTSTPWYCEKCKSPNNSIIYDSFLSFDRTQYSIHSDMSAPDSPGLPIATSSPQSTRSPSSEDSRSPSSEASMSQPQPSRRERKDRPMRVVIMNCQSCCNKKAEISNLLDSTQPDVVIGTESWLHKDIYSSEIFPDNYEVFRNDRQGKHGHQQGGGVFILVLREYLAREVPNSRQEDCELIWVEIQAKGSKNIIIGSFYRPQHTDTSYLNKLHTSLLQISQKNAHVWLGGDFNLPSINWEQATYTKGGRYKQESERMVEISCDLGLEQVVTVSTRITELGENTLDLLFTNNSSLVNRIDRMPPLSDHDVVFAEISTFPTRAEEDRRKIPLYNKTNWEKMRSEAEKLNAAHQDDQDINNMWNRLESGLQDLMKKNIPTRTRNNRRRLPWVNTNIRRLLRKQERQHKRARQTKSPEDQRKFLATKAQVQKELRVAHSNYLQEILVDGSNNQYDNDNKQRVGKRFFSYVKSLKKDSMGVAPLLDEGYLVSDGRGKADILNRQFKSVFTTEDTSSVPTLDNTKYPDIPPLHITEDGVRKLLEGLNPHKAQGPDQLPPRVLKELASKISKPLTDIYRKSVETGCLPGNWRKANISPIFKKGKKCDASNYRPVSLTSVCSKLLEHIIVKHLLKHLNKLKILTPSQHGFRAKMSCETQLVGFIQELAQNMVGGGQTDIVLMDFAKAFDKVAHTRLLNKIHHYGIRGNLHKWIQEFLTTREQRVILENDHSDWTKVDSGVPQGTVLGPLLFLCYINDLPEHVNSQVRLFADDAVIYRKISTDDDSKKLQADLDKLVRWESKWQMSFHPAKCKVMHITRQRNPRIRQYTLRGCNLETEETATYLGVDINNQLDWAPHINRITGKATRSLNFVRRNIRIPSEKVRTKAYQALVRPTLDYCCTVWDPYDKNDIEQLERVQRSAVRYVRREYRRLDENGHQISVLSLQRELKWENLSTRRMKFRMALIYKILYNHVEIPPEPYLIRSDCTNTRGHDKKLAQISTLTNYHQNTFFVRSIPQWNKLTGSIVNAPSLDSFRARLSNYMP